MSSVCFGLRVLIHGYKVLLQFSIMVICFVDEYSIQKKYEEVFSLVKPVLSFYNQ
jgi:hypothetical protein